MVASGQSLSTRMLRQVGRLMLYFGQLCGGIPSYIYDYIKYTVAIFNVLRVAIFSPKIGRESAQFQSDCPFWPTQQKQSKSLQVNIFIIINTKLAFIYPMYKLSLKLKKYNYKLFKLNISNFSKIFSISEKNE